LAHTSKPDGQRICYVAEGLHFVRLHADSRRFSTLSGSFPPA
jgi:hypothetical protein